MFSSGRGLILRYAPDLSPGLASRRPANSGFGTGALKIAQTDITFVKGHTFMQDTSTLCMVLRFNSERGILVTVDMRHYIAVFAALAAPPPPLRRRRAILKERARAREALAYVCVTPPKNSPVSRHPRPPP